MKRARVPWRRDYPSSPAVEAARFQDETEPYPRHWRAFPEPWRPGASIDPETATGLADAFDNLPSTWRDVVTGTDLQHRDPVEVAADLGLTAAWSGRYYRGVVTWDGHCVILMSMASTGRVRMSVSTAAGVLSIRSGSWWSGACRQTT
jgi:hypothetical protein